MDAERDKFLFITFAVIFATIFVYKTYFEEEKKEPTIIYQKEYEQQLEKNKDNK